MNGIGAFAGGLAQGIGQGAEEGQQMGLRGAQMRLEQQRANLEANQAMANVMRIPIPSLRGMAMGNLLPSLHIDPKGVAGKKLLDIAENGDPATLKQYQDLFSGLGVKISPEMLISATSTPEGVNELMNFAIQAGVGKNAQGMIQQVFGGQSGSTDQGQGSTTDVGSQGASPGGTATTTDTSAGGGDAGVSGQPPSGGASASSSTQPTSGGGMPAKGKTQAGGGMPQPGPLASAGIKTIPIPGIPAGGGQSEGMPAAIAPAVSTFQAKIQTLVGIQASSPLYKDRLQPAVDELVRQRDQLVNNYYKTLEASQKQQEIGIQAGQLGVAQGRLAVEQKRLAWDISKPESPPAMLVHDLNMGNLNLAGASGTETTTSATGGTGSAQPAAGGGGAIKTAADGTTDLTDVMPAATKTALIKALGGTANSRIIQLPNGQITTRNPTLTSLPEASQAGESQKALNDITQSRGMIANAIQAIQKDPSAVGLTGDLRGAGQSIATQLGDLASFLPSLKGIANQLPKGYLDYDPNLPQLETVEHILAASVAKEMAASAGGGGRITDPILKKAEDMVNFRHESSADAVSKLQELDKWFSDRQDIYKTEIGQGGQAGTNAGPGGGPGPNSSSQGMPRWAKGDKVTGPNGQELYYQGDGSAKGKAWLPTPPK